jgi:hypothetical protein
MVKRGRPRDLEYAHTLMNVWVSWIIRNQGAFEPTIRIVDCETTGGGRPGPVVPIRVMMPPDVTRVNNIINDPDDKISETLYTIMFEKYLAPHDISRKVSRKRQRSFLKWLSKRLGH